MAFVSAIIVAGGSSSRMGGADKLLSKLGSQTVIERAVDAMRGNALVNELIIVAGPKNRLEIASLCARLPKVKAVVLGGPTRALSVQAGIAAASAESDYYAIHDGARPLASDALITRVIEAALEYGAAAPGVRMVDTVKEIDGENTIIHTPDRSSLVAIATPQVFEATLYRAAAKGRIEALDDCQMLERVGRKVRVVEGERDNIKITEPGDLERARRILGVGEMRVGHGYDVHRLEAGRRLVLGGVEIPFEKGLLGHSDADVLLHALTDALLGAAGLPDIGALFPDSDESYSGADSLKLLARAWRLVREAGFGLVNADATVICQAPKLRPYIEKMRENIASALETEPSRINIKATSEEGLGFTGTGEGIAAHAAALLKED
ncbi:MAG: 2-C-methyl-D-erythritol 2,4-cyclodiphosphate synthase [Oscillospiraceae bacterium]|nr:2-C-methyl-D-erythritol 2,4-cyclodiphosphate synthase [Oscillospiraceae bacterium]